jgi:S1-C subfamily serine protease
VARGPAARAGLQPDDIILSFNGQATPTFEALADAVQQSGSEAEVYYINADTGARETMTLSGVNGRIGITGYGVQVD